MSSCGLVAATGWTWYSRPVVVFFWKCMDGLGVTVNLDQIGGVVSHIGVNGQNGGWHYKNFRFKRRKITASKRVFCGGKNRLLKTTSKISF